MPHHRSTTLDTLAPRTRIAVREIDSAAEPNPFASPLGFHQNRLPGSEHDHLPRRAAPADQHVVAQSGPDP